MYVALMEEEEGNVYRVLVRKPKEGDHLEDKDIDRSIILKWIVKTIMKSRG